MAITEEMMKNTIAPSDLMNEESEISIHVQTCANAINTAMSKLEKASSVLEAFVTEALDGGMTYEQAEEEYFSVVSDLVDEVIHELWG